MRKGSWRNPGLLEVCVSVWLCVSLWYRVRTEQAVILLIVIYVFVIGRPRSTVRKNERFDCIVRASLRIRLRHR